MTLLIKVLNFMSHFSFLHLNYRDRCVNSVPEAVENFCQNNNPVAQ